MDIVFILFVVLQSMAISLGVGSSTLAIINFFVAISDGTIDPQERKLMGVVYIVLRVAMVAILITTGVIALIHLTTLDTPYLTAYTAAFWTLLAVLYVNAVLMTKHIMPSNIGPALQASTWYTLGILTALLPIGMGNLSYVGFLIGYAAAIGLAVGVVNWIMNYQKKKRTQNGQ
jgi:hypothetical protein